MSTSHILWNVGSPRLAPLFCGEQAKTSLMRCVCVGDRKWVSPPSISPLSLLYPPFLFSLSSPSLFLPFFVPSSQVDRNLQDAMQVARNIVMDPYLVPGGGATEMALAQALNERAKSVAGVQQWPYRAVSKALEVIPRTLLQNCGANTIRVLTTLRVSCCAASSMLTTLKFIWQC